MHWCCVRSRGRCWQQGQREQRSSYSSSPSEVPSLACLAVRRDRRTLPFSLLQLRLYSCIGDASAALIFCCGPEISELGSC